MTFPTRSRDEVLAVWRFLADFPCRWWLGGGWAIDAWLGTQSREHEDIEICVARDDQAQIFSYCATWQFFSPVNDQWAPWPPGEPLVAPRFMLQLQRAADTIAPSDMPPTFEFLLNEVHDQEWTFLRDPRVRMPVEQVSTLSPWGMPVAKPELILLHKAVYSPRPKDDHDLAQMLPHLRADQRAWLRDTIHAFYPENPWVARL